MVLLELEVLVVDGPVGELEVVVFDGAELKVCASLDFINVW